jgi:uncharacterized membrane-anchored protein YitT (DUF2179 family)
MKKVFNRLKPHAIITLGLFINALGWTIFLIPAKITGGGVSGIATLIFYATGIPMGIPYLILNGILLIISFRILGTKFVFRTIYSVLILSLFYSLLQTVFKHGIVEDTFMSSVIGGILGGVGVGIVLSQGGSTGGTDIIALMVNKYHNISPGRMILYLDVIIISSSYLIFHSLEKTVYGYVTMAITAYTIDLVFAGSKQSYQIFIISRKSDEIAERIAKEVGRGVTILDGEGWYTREKQKVLLIMVRKTDAGFVFRIIKQVDKEAFFSMAPVMGVYGQGFEKLKG